MKKFSALLIAIFFVSCSQVFAKDQKQFPNVSGDVLFQLEADRVMSTQATGVSPNNAYVYIEPNLALNFDKNWSLKTDWRIMPNSTLTTRNQTYPERYRTFLQSNRGLNLQDTGMMVEELKLQFANEDLKASVGKFDPTFGTLYKKSKRIGVFTAQFAEDYNLREKIGGNITALLEHSNVTFNTFFNDTTGLSSSAGDNRGRASRNDGVAGNTGTVSSYAINMNGEKFFGVKNWFYNLGYRSLDVDKMAGRKKETGYTISSEYLHHLSDETTIVPVVELVKINNFTGLQNRDATYTTLALIGSYSSWSASVASLHRNIKQASIGTTPKVSDRQLQFSVGYKFNDNFTIDVSRSNLKEGGRRASLLGVMASYIYKF